MNNVIRPYANQNFDIRDFNFAAAQIYLFKFIKELLFKQLLLHRFNRLQNILKRSANAFKNHMKVKRKFLVILSDQWDKEIKKMRIWSKDVADVYKRYSLGACIRDFWKYPIHLTK